jgi:hypothetical protein
MPYQRGKLKHGPPAHWKMGPDTRGYGGHRAWLP